MKALILGAGISGKSANKLLKKLGYSTYLLDDKKKISYKGLLDRLLCDLSLLVVSPGVELDHPIVCLAKEKNIEVVGELELGFRFLKCPAIAITGTNGKTTTTTLAGELLKGEKNVFVGGNIGTAVTSFALQTETSDLAVLEVSSFQLESISRFAPHIAVLLNITSDHLNRHKTFENYKNAKLRIFENQTEADYAILNLDDAVVMGINKEKIKAQKLYFSTKSECEGCYLKNGNIYFSFGGKTEMMFSASEIPLIGEHNISNALAALLIAKLLGYETQNLREKIHKFRGVSHRLEYITEIDGVTFINDSKSTNISSCVVAMRATNEPTTLILGGSDKGLIFDELFSAMPSSIKNIVVLGETKQKIIEASKRFSVSNVYEAETLKEAVLIAKSLASSGETILFSPACASFDMFENYEQRGKIFTKIVREIEKSENRKIFAKKRKKVQN